jgi:hypothetical protein
MTSPIDVALPVTPTPGAGAPPTPAAWQAAFDAALPYQAFLDRHANPDQRSRWDAFHGRVSLAPAQKALLGGFVRKMPVLVLAGAWCGDCVNQCPIFAAHMKVCGGQRVPTVMFLSEDFTPILFYGDKTLSAYRAAAAAQLGTSCSSGAVPPPSDAIAAVVSDWLDQFERAQLIVRLSGRLRQLHGD